MTGPLEKAIDTIIRVANPDKIILFGSQARNEQKIQSDYDLLVLKKNLKNNRKIVQNIYLNLINIGAPIDILALDLEKYEALKSDPYLIYFDADKNGKVIYEKQSG